MTKFGDNAMTDDDQALEELLGHATPRPMPPAEVMTEARAAMHQEWQKFTRSRLRRRRQILFASAATFVLGITLVMNTWFAPAVQSIQVATLEKAIGAIYVLGEQSELRAVDDLKIVKSGETIVTAKDSGVGLQWLAGGSLRLGANTEVKFVSADAIELQSGRVYFDSMSHTDVAAALVIGTEYGDVTHIGTQFIAAVDSDGLTVRVREGRVSIDGRYHDVVAARGQQLKLVGSRQPEFLNINGYGPEWEWVETTAPVAAMSGKKLYDFLVWVSRETGLSLRFESDDVERVVRQESVAGDISETPRDALRQSLLSADLLYDIDNGVIIVRQAGK